MGLSDDIDRLEDRVSKLEIKSAVDFERHQTVIRRLDKIDGHINKLVWLLIATIVSAATAYAFNGHI